MKSQATVLQRILSQTRAELEQRKRSAPLPALEAQAAHASQGAHASQTVNASQASHASQAAHASQAVNASQASHVSDGRARSFREALAGPTMSVIAEFKRRSPSAGCLREQSDLEAVVKAYEHGGASALSVLTEGPNFEGSLEDLMAARACCELPILRKDFIVDPYQLYEARIVGADAVLLIVAALEQEQLSGLYGLASHLGLDVLVEVHDSEELARAAAVGARLIGINNRDLHDFSVDVGRTERLLGEVPGDALVVSESGISTAAQLRELERNGVAGVLVGEMLMRSADPGRALAALLEGSAE